MSFRSIHLNKLLRTFASTGSARRSILREDARNTYLKDTRDGRSGSGGNFYTPFWSDAKEHIRGVSDIRETTRQRIDDNHNRRRIYPQLRDGLLGLYDADLRWTNQPVEPFDFRAPARLQIPELTAEIKLEGALGLRFASSEVRVLYPYYYPDPSLPADIAQLGIWIMYQMLNEYPEDSYRILDVIRSRSFSSDLAHTITRDTLISNYAALLSQWDELYNSYSD